MITATRVSASRPAFMLILRLLLFAALQAVFALILSFMGMPQPWAASQAWWPIVVILANIVTLILLSRLFRAEGMRYRDLWRFNRPTLGRDLLTVLGLGLVAGVIGFFPNLLVSQAVFGDTLAGNNMIIGRLPYWAALLQLVLFPVTQGLAELPTYFGYAMPRLEALTGKPWLAVLLSSFFLGLQHITIPLIFDARYLVWRGLEFMLFALFLGVVIRWRPRLLPYWMIFHVLIDLSAAFYVLAAAQ